MCRFRHDIIRSIIITGVISLLLFLPSCQYLRKQLKIGEYSLKSVREWPRQDSIWVADSPKKVQRGDNVQEQTLKDSVERVISVKKDFEKTLTDSLLSIEAKGNSKKIKATQFHIITGSYSNQGNAEKGARRYTALGYEPIIINAINRDGAEMKLVSVRIFNDYNEAKKFLKSFQKQTNPDAWIFKSILKE
jgi:hypothetical protein